MAQYIPIHIPLQSPQTPPSLPERPTSVSTSSTVGSPYSSDPYSASFTATTELPPCPPQSEDVKVPTSQQSLIQISFYLHDKSNLNSFVAISFSHVSSSQSSLKELNWEFFLPPTELVFHLPTRMNERCVCHLMGSDFCRNRVGLLDGIWNWDLMFIRIGRGILKFLRLHIKIWKSGGLLWINLISNKMKMGFISSIV